MNMNFKLDLNLKSLLSLGQRFGPGLAGLALIGLFGYTGWVINQAFNVAPAASASTSASPAPPKIVFDKATIQTLKSLRVVPGDVATGDLGKSDPFGQ